MPGQPRFVIAIAGGKGGCGKTTTALGVARALAARGQSVRAIDLDTGMPNLHVLAGVDREPTLADVCEAGAAGGLQRDASGVAVVPAPRVTAEVDLESALSTVRTRCPATTLLDCPAGAGPDAVEPLRLASAVLLVSTDRPESVEDAAKTGRMARELGVPVVAAAVTRTDEPSGRTLRSLPTDRAIGIPAVGDPLAAGRSRERYGDLATLLERCARSADRPMRRPNERVGGNGHVPSGHVPSGHGPGSEASSSGASSGDARVRSDRARGKCERVRGSRVPYDRSRRSVADGIRDSSRGAHGVAPR